PEPNTAATKGTNNPAAIKALILFSNASRTSKGFLSDAGMAVPKASLRNTRATITSAGIQNQGRPNQGRPARLAAGVLKYFQAPTALTPSNGEMATPVMVERACAACRPVDEFVEESGAGLVGSEATGPCADRPAAARATIRARPR